MKIIVDNLIYESLTTGKKFAYHSSPYEFNSGQILDGKLADKDYYKNKAVEQILEKTRQEKYPDKISRFSCVFSSPYKNHTFTYKGFTYIVELIGKTHYADSEIITEINNKAFDLLYSANMQNWKTSEQIIYLEKRIETYPFDWYWKGKLGEKKDIEILSEKIKILGLYEPKSFLYAGGKYEVIKPIFVNLGSKNEVKDDELILKNYFDNLEFENRFYWGYLKPKTNITITHIRENNYNPHSVSFKINGLETTTMSIKSDNKKGFSLNDFSKNFFEEHLKKLA